MLLRAQVIPGLAATRSFRTLRSPGLAFIVRGLETTRTPVCNPPNVTGRSCRAFDVSSSLYLLRTASVFAIIVLRRQNRRTLKSLTHRKSLLGKRLPARLSSPRKASSYCF